jgi:hypothetical protein
MEDEVQEVEGQEPEIEAPAESTPDKGKSSADLHGELMDFPDGSGDEGEATDSTPDTAGTPAEPAKAPALSVLEMILPDDPSLPESYRGKVTVEGLFKNERKLVTEYQKSREETNTLKTKLEVQNAIIESLRRVGFDQQAPPQQAQPMTEDELWAAYGINDVNATLFDNPKAVLSAMRQMVRDEQMAVAQPIAERIENFEAQTMRERANGAAQEAWVGGYEVIQKTGANIDPDHWRLRSPEVLQLVREDYQRWASDPEQQAARPNPTRDPLCYAAAYKTVEARWSTPGAPAPVPAPAAAPVSARVAPVAAPPHETRAAASSFTSTPKVSSRMEAEIREWAKEWGQPVEKVRQMFLEVESEGAR